jgi:HD-GYP domain-containing protein (c-di-GMP phosphodiesterase class II)
MICREVGWTASQTLFKAAIAGLMHDIGKKEIDQHLLAKRPGELTESEAELIKTHATRGMEILSDVPSIPPDLIQAVLQHHEDCAGTGYPAGLTKATIQPLARLIAVADELVDLIVPGPGQPRLSPRDALVRLQALHGDKLDPAFVTPLYTILGLASRMQSEPLAMAA